jgi:hypothetical protein
MKHTPTKFIKEPGNLYPIVHLYRETIHDLAVEQNVVDNNIPIGPDLSWTWPQFIVGMPMGSVMKALGNGIHEGEHITHDYHLHDKSGEGPR